ncbi:ABC transporter permease [Lentibacillus halophilus]|uniref:ABC transporter permease n=1 Tax=Lentibacillus halophilus TaxID=295065 RepID=A0ABN0Z752_9BACI
MYDYNYFSVFYKRLPDLLETLYEHVIISGIAILLGCIIAIPIGIFLSWTSIRWIKSTILNITNVFQTIPTLALLAMLLPLFGIGMKPAIVALFLYSLMPIMKNTYAGFESIDSEIIQSAEGMGYSPLQRLLQIEIPLAVPYIMSGIRLTTVYIVSWAVLAGLIGGGGLGQLIVTGMGLNDQPLIIAASVFSMILVLITDFLLGTVEKLFSRKGQPEKQNV